VISLTTTGVGGGITVTGGSGVISRVGSTITVQTTQGGNILVNTLIDANTGDGRVELFSDGSISVPGLITGGEAILLAQTGIAANTYMPSGVAATSTISGDISINSNLYVKLNTISAPGNLTITSSGNINQNNPITVAGIASFNAANGIDLTNASNNFMGTVNLSNSGTNNVAITDANSITIGTTSLGTGTLTVNAVGITQSGAITQASGAGTATFNGGAGVISLNNSGNNFTGVVKLNNSSANNVAITDINTINLGASTLGSGTLTVNAVGITQTGAITQASSAGTATFNAGAGAITLTNASNNFTGSVSLTNSRDYRY
jgi:hypothetical protein